MSSSNQASSRKSKGRQKLNMVKMQNQSNLQVTFSKRRAGLFKKASELCTLCGAEASIVVFSPANKVYCFGHPNAKTVCDRFTTGAAPVVTNNPTSQLIIEAHRNSAIRELNLELTQVESMLRAERKHGEELDRVRKTGQSQLWFPPSLNEFNYEQLSILKESIMRFKKHFDAKVQRDMFTFANCPPPFYPHAGTKEHLWGFSPGVGADVSYAPLPLGSNGFPDHTQGANEFSYNDLFTPVGGTSKNCLAVQGSHDPMSSSAIDLASCDFLKASSFTGTSSASGLLNDPENRGLDMSLGFNIGYGTPGLF